MNEPLRQAMLRARLREDDVAARLGVDPKTVRRWLSGRVPYANNRVALADMLGVNEADLWPDAGGPLTTRIRPDELAAVYPSRSAISHDVWGQFFRSAEHEIGISAYSALFLAEDSGLLGIIADKATYGVRVRLALGDPESENVAHRGRETGIGNALAEEVRDALTLYRPLLASENVEIRLHQTILPNSIYRTDGQVLINQHIYGIPADQSPVFLYRESEDGRLTASYIESFERVWTSAKSME